MPDSRVQRSFRVISTATTHHSTYFVIARHSLSRFFFGKAILLLWVIHNLYRTCSVIAFPQFCHPECNEGSLRALHRNRLSTDIHISNAIYRPAARACLGSAPPKGAYFWLDPKVTKDQGLDLFLN
jgi:hypothetical protein